MSSTSEVGTILVIDDEPHVLAVLNGVLIRHGYKVITAQHGMEAIEQLRDSPSLDVDLLLVDLALPDLNGVEVVRRIHEFRPGIPVLYLSGLFQQEIEAGESEPGIHHLAKPFSPQQLVEEVRKALGKSASSK